eukprot:NODE_864_length_3433_cov_0.732454.p3 type:complete len:119 gc:universal NODE_864_length_3433_cov_0.732454:1190-1546(+)
MPANLFFFHITIKGFNEQIFLKYPKLECLDYFVPMVNWGDNMVVTKTLSNRIRERMRLLEYIQTRGEDQYMQLTSGMTAAQIYKNTIINFTTKKNAGRKSRKKSTSSLELDLVSEDDN